MAARTVGEVSEVDPNIWKACAGNSVQIPTVGSMVYYFPQGHSEQASSPPDFSSSISVKPYVFCRIVSVRFLAEPETDRPFAKIRLEPLDRSSVGGFLLNSEKEENGGEDDDDEEEEEKIVSFSKILTQSDANNGGGFSVPRFCADSVFPPLDYSAKPPVQAISVRDVHGVAWEFRHIFRGTPLRHLLTTGWSKFVNSKSLVSGDSVVFMKNRSGDLFVGIRRTFKLSAIGDCGRWSCHVGEGATLEGFSRSNAAGRVSPESVLEAAELSGVGRPFEIDCYPKAGSPIFVVKADMVEASMNMYWTAGMRIKMAVETEDMSRMTWFQGTVSAVALPGHRPWHGSPWRALQVNWDEPEVLKNVKSVNPWQVELVDATSPPPTPFPPTKKLRVTQNSELLTNGRGDIYFPMRVSNSTMGHLNSSLFHCNISPAGMQGARHDLICVPSLASFVGNNMHHMYSEHLYGNNMAPKLGGSMPIDLNIEDKSQSDNSSLHSQGSLHSFSTDVLGKQSCNSTTKANGVSFTLFGKIIHTCQPVAAGIDTNGCTEDDGGIGYKETEGVIKTLDSILTRGYMKGLTCNAEESQLWKNGPCEGSFGDEMLYRAD